MRSYKRFMPYALSLVLLGAAFAFADPPGGVPPGHQVLVVNPPSSPVPVTIGSSAASPVVVLNVEELAREPFQSAKAFLLPVGTFSEATEAFAVPAGKRLIITHISAAFELPAGQRPLWEVTIISGTVGAAHFLPAQFQSSGAGAKNVFVASEDLEVRADPGTSVGVFFGRDDDAGAADGVVSIAGYLVDVP
ncbi:MAG: hypothetical protein HY320_14940 [Armatimonadetes bacterium]|nr:hypothetical protein [Armatimonadota bacterium]